MPGLLLIEHGVSHNNVTSCSKVRCNVWHHIMTNDSPLLKLLFWAVMVSYVEALLLLIASGDEGEISIGQSQNSLRIFVIVRPYENQLMGHNFDSRVILLL